MQTADQIVDAMMADTTRDKRSKEYWAGMRAILRFRLDGFSLPGMPYPLGTASADAYFSGQDRGHVLARELFTEQQIAGLTQKPATCLDNHPTTSDEN